MKNRAVIAIAFTLICITISAQGDGRPTCRNCPSTYVPRSEVQAYVDRAIKNNLVDQQIRMIDSRCRP